MGGAEEEMVRYQFVLGEIARGRCDNGRPLAAEIARQMARHVLDTYGRPWPARQQPKE